MNLYEVNCSGYNSLPPLTKEEKIKAHDLIADYLTSTSNHHYVLINHESHYFTVFHWVYKTTRKFTCDIMDVVSNLGAIKAIELSENKEMIEFWITNPMTNTCHMYGFLAYDGGVIET